MTFTAFDRWATVHAIRPLLDIGLVRPAPAIPILMYHTVSNDTEPGVWPYYRVATSPARFRDQMQYLRDLRIEVIGVTAALRLLSAGVEMSDRFVVLTFDDGLDDFRTHAWPVLETFGFTATVFLPTAFIGESRKSFKGRKCLNWADIRALYRDGVAFGGHTVSHPVLHNMCWAAIRRELTESRKRIEDEIQDPVQSFAYPYAFPQEDRRFVAGITRELKAAGYDNAVTTMIGRAQANCNPLQLRRLPVNENDDHALFASKLEGAYDWIGWVQLWARVSKRLWAWSFQSSS